MIRVSLSILLAVCLATAPVITVPAAAAAEPQQVWTGEIVSTVNFRDKPSLSGNRIRYLKKGETVAILRKVNDYWLEVKDAAGRIGYVSSLEKYIQIESANAGFEPNGQIIATVNFRTGPSTDASPIRYLKKGELIQITEKVNAYWYKAFDANGTAGYVSSNPKYVETFFGEAPAGEEPVYVDEPNGTVVATVSFRTGPSTSAARIRYLQAGEPLWIVDKPNAYWFKAKDKNGVLGYVSSSAQYVRSGFLETYKTLDRATIAEKVIQAGLKYLGTPYEFGSSRNDTTTFDCSDFVRQAYLDGIGYRLPGDSRSQGEHVLSSGNPIVTDWRQLQPGDLMFFMDYKGFRAGDYAHVDKQKEKITHVGIYLGNGQVLHTYSAASGGVRTNEIAGTQWEYRFLFGGYPIP